MDAAKTRRRELAPRRKKKQRAIADAFKNFAFAPDNQPDDAAERINIEQIRSIHELHATTPSLRRCLESTLASVFGDRGLVMTTADQTEVELDDMQRLYISEFWLEPLRRAAAQLVMYGCVALDTEPIGSAHTPSAFLALARSTGGPGTEAVARKNPKLVVLKLDDVRLDFESGHYIVDRPKAVFIEQSLVDVDGNVSSAAASASNLYGFSNALAEVTLDSWSVLAKPQVVTQQRHGPSASKESDMLFFDTESRALRASDDVQEETQRAGLMQLMVAQCARLNDLQTRTVAPFATSKEQPAPKEPASKPDIIVIPKDSEVASGAARPQANSVRDLVSLFEYTDQTANDLYASDAGNNTLVSAEEHAAARKASTATLRALLNRVLTVMYTPVGKNG